jgi:hypothetical protein
MNAFIYSPVCHIRIVDDEKLNIYRIVDSSYYFTLMFHVTYLDNYCSSTDASSQMARRTETPQRHLAHHAEENLGFSKNTNTGKGKEITMLLHLPTLLLWFRNFKHQH